MTHAQLGLILIIICAVAGGGLTWRGNPNGWYLWAPAFCIVVIALLMLLGKVFA